VSNLQAYEIALLNILVQEYGLRRGLAYELVMEDRGWGNDGSRCAQEQALDRIAMMAIAVLWSVP